MYAVFATGGKQYRATTGDILKIEKLNAEKGTTIELDQVLMMGEGADVTVGAPYIKGGKVTAKVVEHGRGEKIRIIKFHRRKHHRKQMGHRQDFTRIEITGIAASAPQKTATEAKTTKSTASKAKTTKSTASKAKTTKSTASKAKTAKPTASKAKTAKSTASKAKTTKAKITKPKAAAAAKAESKD